LFREGFWVTDATEMDNKYDDEQSYEILSPGRFDCAMDWHVAMKEPDGDQFLKAVQQEAENHCQNDVWEMILRIDVPKGIKVLPSVWAM
jgi:hypothetical protein